MKDFIRVWIVLLFTGNLHATNQYAEDVIVPEYFSSTKNHTNYVEEIIIPETDSSPISEEAIFVTEDYINKNIPSSDDIIIPESFKKNKETSINTLTDVISQEPIIEVSTTQNNIIDKDTDIPDLDYAGYYNLLKGSTHLGGNFQQLNYGFLVIEKLDENDFGFYYVIQKGNSAPNNRYGIFHYKKGKFFQKFLDDSPLRDNVKVLKSGLELSTMITGNLGEYNLHWQEVSANDINSLSSKLQEYLKDTKENYRQIYKEKFKS